MQYMISFEQVQLISGLAADQQVWLYLRATLFNDHDLQTPLAMCEVGSLPPDANRMSDPSYPKGDAGQYAPGLPLMVEVRNDSDNGGPRFQLAPLTVLPGQTVEVQVIMLPKVWFKEVEVSRDELASFAEKAFIFLISASYTFPIAAGAVAVFEGIFGGGSDTVPAPCLQTVITARHLFAFADLEAIRAEGMRRFGPADNDLSPICGLIDSFYWLSVTTHTEWPSFGRPANVNSGTCELKPHAHFPKKSSWLEGTWSDSGDPFNFCLICTVLIDANDRATVFLTQGRPGPDNPAREFANLEINLTIPDLPFARNVFDDACPARSVVPACPNCSQFTNLPLSFMADKRFLAMAALAHRHVGAHRLFSPHLNSAHLLENTPMASRLLEWSAAGVKTVGKSATKTSDVTTSSVHQNIQPRFSNIALGERITPSLSAKKLQDGRIEFTPVGTPPLHLFDHLNSPRLYRYDERHDIVALIGSFHIVLNERESLYSYGEFHQSKACIGRLRYVKKDLEGHVLADILLMGVSPIIK